MEKIFRYSDEKKSLDNNQRHSFALQNTLSIFPSDSAYTFIPKNACSTLRYSIGIANGCISNFEDIDWIHTNNRTFSMTTERAFRAKYKFVILRCPFSRLFSSFMDKAVNMDIQIWQYRNARGRTFHPHDLTFEYFVKDLMKVPSWSFDIHWRPQVDFLLYEKYDDIFCVEDFSMVVRILKAKINLDVYDTRPILKHHLGELNHDLSIEMPFKKKALELLLLKRRGVVPDATTMYNEELVSIVRLKYKEDIELYLRYFSPSTLMKALL